MLSMSPVVPLAKNQASSIGLTSYDGSASSTRIPSP